MLNCRVDIYIDIHTYIHIYIHRRFLSKLTTLSLAKPKTWALDEPQVLKV